MCAESSKKAAKRHSKEQEAAVAATMYDRSNGPIRISDAGSNTRQVESPNVDAAADSSQQPKKKTRGPSKLKMHDKGKQKCDEIDFNERNQPIGPESVQLSTLEGILARELVSINIDYWVDVPIEIKDKLWDCVKLRYKIHDIHKTHVMQKFAKLWSNHKSELSRKIRTLAITGKGHLARNIALTKPDNIGMAEWKAFVKNRLSKGFIEKSNKFRDMRAKQNVLHTMSRKGYARLEEEMKNQSPHPDSISRVDVWIKGHTRKKGKPVNEVHQAAVKKVEELHKPSTEEGPMSIKDDAVVHAFGLERRGSVQGLGFGALPSKVDAQVYQNQNVRKLNQQMLLLQQELQEMRAKILKGKRQNKEPSEDAMGRKRSHGETQDKENSASVEHRVHRGGEHRMHSQENIGAYFGKENSASGEHRVHKGGEHRMHLQENIWGKENNASGEHRVHKGSEHRMHLQETIWGDENSEGSENEDIWLHDENEIGNGGSNLDNAKCKLLNWDGTKVVVAEGTIASTDSKQLVHHVPLGPGCWKVWVNHVKVNALLFRPNREMFVLEDAIGSTIAWTNHFINFDFE